MWTVYRNPADYPGQYVVRRSMVTAGLVAHDRVPAIVTDSLEQARNVIPKGLCQMGRADQDEPQILEVWF